MPEGDIPYAELVWRGKLGPATLSKPEPGWGTTIPQDLEHETSAGRQVPSPKKQELQDLLRGESLRMQAKNRELRDTVVRGGATRGIRRQFGRGLTLNRAGGIPSWGTSNVRYAHHGTTVKEAADLAGLKKVIGGKIKEFGRAIENWANEPAVIPSTPPPTPPTPTPMPTPTPTRPQIQPVPLSQPGQRFSQLRQLVGMRRLSQIEQASPKTILRMAEQRQLPISAWTRTLNNPIADMMIQMGAITAVEPVLSALGVQHPIFYMLAPWAIMSYLPDYLRKWSGIEKIRHQLLRGQRARILGRPVASSAPAPSEPLLEPEAFQRRWDAFMSKMKPVAERAARRRPPK